MTARRLEPGLATAVGSLPHRDPAAAVALVLDLLPDLPAAPSLPRRSPLEGMLGQAAAGVPGVALRADGSLAVDPTRLDPDGTTAGGVDGPGFACLRAFLAAVAGRTGPVKLQLTGPVTFGVALARAGAPGERAFPVAAAAVRARARAVLAAARAAVPAATLVVVLDEPGLVTAFRPGFPLPAERTVDLLSGALAALEPEALTGIHCCGPTDWGAVLAAGPDLVSAPVGGGLDRVPAGLAGFLERGGRVAWGAVPTDGPVGDRPEPLARRLAAEWRALAAGGCDPDLLRRQSLVTPVCGLAGHDPRQARATLALAVAVARATAGHPVASA